MNLRRAFFEWVHQMTCMYVACEDSWYSASCRHYGEYWQCDGDLHLNWKDKGFRTVLDLLQVSFEHTLFSEILDVQSIFVVEKNSWTNWYNWCWIESTLKQKGHKNRLQHDAFSLKSYQSRLFRRQKILCWSLDLHRFIGCSQKAAFEFIRTVFTFT